MVRFDYKTEHVYLQRLEKTLKEMGFEGWELVQVISPPSGNFQDGFYLIFKKAR